MTAAANPLLPAASDVVWSVVAVAMLVLAVVALVSIARGAKRLTAAQALGWTLLAVLVPVVGPLAWLFIGRRASVASASPAVE